MSNSAQQIISQPRKIGINLHPNEAPSHYRHLQLPLVDSERSWAFALECKAELDGPKAGLMRQAMLRRLSKASAHAATFSKFAAARADPRCSFLNPAVLQCLQFVFVDMSSGPGRSTLACRTRRMTPKSQISEMLSCPPGQERSIFRLLYMFQDTAGGRGLCSTHCWPAPAGVSRPKTSCSGQAAESTVSHSCQ